MSFERNLSDQDLSSIKDIVAEQIRTQFERGCLCGLKPAALQEMGHFWGMLEDVGYGDPARSVETLRTIIKTQHRIEAVSSKAMIVAVSVIVTTACYGAFSGIKTLWSASKAIIFK